MDSNLATLRTNYRHAIYLVSRCEREHAEALAMLNRLSPNPPAWARAAVAAAWRALLASQRAERRALDAFPEK
jgi:hypothetical protein